MKNFFKKAIVAVGVMASTLALSSVVAFADITTTTTGTAIKTATSGTYDATIIVSGVSSAESAPTRLIFAGDTSYNLYVQRAKGNGTTFTYNNTAYSGAAKITANTKAYITGLSAGDIVTFEMQINGGSDNSAYHIYFGDNENVSSTTNIGNVNIVKKAATQINVPIETAGNLYFVGEKEILLGAIAIKRNTPAEEGKISGTITNSTNDAAIALDSLFDEIKCGDYTATATETGYEITNIPNGTYSVTYSGKDYDIANESTSVTITDESKEQTLNLSLTPKPYITLTASESNVTTGGTFTLTPAPHNYTPIGSCTYTVEPEGAVTFDGNTATAVMVGDATITCTTTYNNETLTADVKVTIAGNGATVPTTANECKFNYANSKLSITNNNYVARSANGKSGISIMVNGDSLTQGLKMESSTQLLLNAKTSGTLYIVATANDNSVGKGAITINGETYLTDDNGYLAVENIPVGEVTIVKGNTKNNVKQVGTVVYVAYSGTIGLTAGSYPNTADASSGIVVMNDSGTAFVIAYIPETLMDADSIDIKINASETGSKPVNTKTVYKKIKANGVTYDADQIDDVSALYGFKISNVVLNSQLDAIKAFTVEAKA